MTSMNTDASAAMPALVMAMVPRANGRGPRPRPDGRSQVARNDLPSKLNMPLTDRDSVRSFWFVALPGPAAHDRARLGKTVLPARSGPTPYSAAFPSPAAGLPNGRLVAARRDACYLGLAASANAFIAASTSRRALASWRRCLAAATPLNARDTSSPIGIETRTISPGRVGWTNETMPNLIGAVDVLRKDDAAHDGCRLLKSDADPLEMTVRFLGERG